MKKQLLLTVFIIAILASFSIASAQSETDLSALTGGESFDWSGTKDDLMEEYSEIPGLACVEIENETFGNGVSCSMEGYAEGEALYTFFFKEDETLAMVETIATYLTEEMPMAQMFDYMKVSLSALEMEPYEEGKFFDALVDETNLVYCGLIPETAHVCVLGVEASEKPYISIFYIDPVFVSAFDTAE